MSKSRLIQSIIFGVIIWYLAALFIRYYGNHFFGESRTSQSSMVLYILSTLPTLLWIVIVKLQGKTPMGELYDAVMNITYIGAILDGVAMVFFPQQIYVQPPQILGLGAAWLLWVVGTGMVTAYIFKITDKSYKGFY